MSIRDLVPGSRKSSFPAPAQGGNHPVTSLQREVNRLFDVAFQGFPLGFGEVDSQLSKAWPCLEVSDENTFVRVTVELPGLEEKDVELLIEDGVLTIRGERRPTQEDKDRQFSERFYGRFERRVSLGYDIDEDKVSAEFKNGILTAILPKVENAAPKAKRIPLNKS